MFWGHMWGGSMWFGWFFWLIIIGLIVWLIINNSSRNRNNMHHFPPQAHHENALDILKKRYAKGEINKEQFDQMKHDLEN